MRRRLPLLLLLLAALTAGCGGDDRKGAVQTAERWLRAVADREFDTACSLMQESAVNTIRRRSGLNEKATCLGTLRVYSGAFRPGDIDGILKIGFEAEGRIKENQLGVFPKSGSRELQVILMQRVDDEWKVASTTLGPTDPGLEPSPTATASPTATPAGD